MSHISSTQEESITASTMDIGAPLTNAYSQMSISNSFAPDLRSKMESVERNFNLLRSNLPKIAEETKMLKNTLIKEKMTISHLKKDMIEKDEQIKNLRSQLDDLNKKRSLELEELTLKDDECKLLSEEIDSFKLFLDKFDNDISQSQTSFMSITEDY